MKPIAIQDMIYQEIVHRQLIYATSLYAVDEDGILYFYFVNDWMPFASCY